MELEVNYFCESCKKDAFLDFWIEGHDEFDCQNKCPECGAKIPADTLHKIITDNITHFVSSRIDYAHDYLKERL